MKQTKGKVKRTVLLLVVFIVGCLTGLMVSSYLYYRHVFSKAVNQSAIDLSGEIRRLSQLRLGDVDAAIEDSERTMDYAIVSIATTSIIATLNQ